VRVLIVDAKLARGEQLCEYVLASGYTVSSCDKENIIQEVSKTSPDILVIDILVPRPDFFSELSHIRVLYPALGIVMMTDNLQEQSYWDGLRNGADYYLLRNAPLCILGATLHALQRRLLTVNTIMSPVDTWTLNVMERNLSSSDGVEVKFTAKECSVLSFLIQNSRQPVAGRKISQMLGYSDLIQSQHRVNILIYRIRAKLKNIENTAFEIHNIYAQGFLFSCKAGVRCMLRSI
jgi:DNA-binding response OmpR family regulator